MKDPAGFEDFCQRHYSRLAGLAFLLTRDRQEAQDLAQEGLARAFERWGRVSRLDRPDAWVQRVVVNLAHSWKRRLRRVLPVALPPDQFVIDPEVSDPALVRALGVLTPGQRTVIVLRFFLDWSVAQVADALGKQPGTVRALTAQGLDRLRRTLTQQEVSDEARG
ncbi:MAG: SigE family RNA polymerase sigma factor [Actinomycetota bacterium]